jgi:hypothetical protein
MAMAAARPPMPAPVRPIWRHVFGDGDIFGDVLSGTYGEVGERSIGTRCKENREMKNVKREMRIEINRLALIDRRQERRQENVKKSLRKGSTLLFRIVELV